MSKKLLISLAVICVLILAFVGINLKKDNVFNDVQKILYRNEKTILELWKN